MFEPCNNILNNLLFLYRRVGKSLTCKTSKAMAEDLNKFLFVEAEFDLQTVTSAQRFMYVSDPVVNKITKKKAIVRYIT